MLYVQTINEKANNTRAALTAAQSRAARKLLFDSVKQEYGLSLSEGDIIIGEHGKPCFKNYPNISFSISHSGSLIAVLLADRPCGVDVQRIKPCSAALHSRVCTEDELKILAACDSPERTFIRLWTLKESFVKAVGRGIGYGLKNISFSFRDDEIISSADAEFTSKELDDYILSVCLLRQSNKNS